MSRWFRFHDDALHDPKVQMLPAALFKTWINVLCVASRNDGKLPAVHEMAYLLRKPADAMQRDLDELLKRHLVDLTDGQMEPHNWQGRQFKSDVSTERVKRHRKHQRNVSSAVSETPPETDTEAETDQSRENAREPREAAFDQFWQIFPNKVGKADALKAFKRAAKKVSLETMMDGLQRYVAKNDDRPWCNPATWLNGGRWEDQPARTNGHGHAKTQGSLASAADDLIREARELERGTCKRDDLFGGDGTGQVIDGSVVESETR